MAYRRPFAASPTLRTFLDLREARGNTGFTFLERFEQLRVDAIHLAEKRKVDLVGVAIHGPAHLFRRHFIELAQIRVEVAPAAADHFPVAERRGDLARSL